MSKELFSLLAASFLLALLLSPKPVLANSPQAKEVLKWKKATFKRLEENLSQPLSNRVIAMPDDMLRDLIVSDQSIGIASAKTYTTRSASLEEQELVKHYTRLLPPLYKTLFAKKLMAIFPVNNFGGAGLLSWVLKGDGEIYYYMILNTKTFDRSIDDWLSFRSNSIFDRTITDPFVVVTTSTSYKALLYVLLHEGAHLLDYEVVFTPQLERLHSQTSNRNVVKTPFVAFIWEGQNQPVEKYKLDYNGQLNIYGIYQHIAMIPGTKLSTMFGKLTQTPFVSFYSSTSWTEHFADFLTYHHIEKYLKGKIKLKLMQNDSIKDEFTPMEADVTQPLVSTIEAVYQ